MSTNLTASLLLILVSICNLPIHADPLATILIQMDTLMKAAKAANNVMDLLRNYPPIFVEYFLAAFDKETPVPRRSYDFIVDLTQPTDIFENLRAYPVSFPLGKDVYDRKICDKIDRFVVNVVGRYNVGKTYVLRLLANIDLGHSFTERTIGISVSLPSPSDTNETPLALIDTAGTRTPVIYEAETFKNISYQRQVSDSFIQEIAFNSAEIFVFVVNQLTLDDQLYLKTLTKRLTDKGFKDRDIKQQLLLVHNYFNLETVEQVKQVEEIELRQLFNATKNFQGYWLSENFKHFVIAHSNSPAGKKYNTKSIKNIRTMIRGAVPGRNPDILKTIIKEIESLLGKVLVEKKSNDVSKDTNNSEKREHWIGRTIQAIWGSGKEELKVSNKKKVKLELGLKKVDAQNMGSLWVICPREALSNSITLSNNLGFNPDGSVYVDFSSHFVPDLGIARLNEKGDVVIHIECPSCKDMSVKRRGMTSILVRGTKITQSFEEAYLETRCMGEFEMEISLEGLKNSPMLNPANMHHEFIDGVFRITIPNDENNDQFPHDEI